ncbi:hypothetical protein QCD70_16495 [Agreia sp. PsM10]|uniref:hypothetical protein n=1 Tax=Agreia sp. PsM10 TaxID=3030533 RepID=UPI00263B9192|nr:hypothetical protein [Agreia sp. PsM10]MDN4641850.1 hypothetical protein [Agreia sp. PsM10]
MSQFNVIDNVNLPPSAVPAAPRTIEVGHARNLITDRQWHVTGENRADAAALVTPTHSGLFLTGENSRRAAADLRARYSDTPFIVEPQALRDHWADEDAPFAVPDGSGGFDVTLPLEAMLDRQRLGGNPLAMTPTGQIRVGDSEALKAVIETANDLDREDVLVAVPLAANWLGKQPLTDQIIMVLNRSRHPIALTFTDGKGPLESMVRTRAHRRLIASTTAEILAYRIDLNGFDAIAQGAVAAAIGAYPSKRRLDPVDANVFGPKDREALSPQMLIPDMLRIVRSTEMRKKWFVSAPPMDCFCRICGGSPIDRLHESTAERAAGHRHNVVGIERLASIMLGTPRPQRAAVWAGLVEGALDTYPQLESHLGRPVRIPNDLGVWGEPTG